MVFREALHPDRIGIWKCWFLGRGENWSTRRKTSRSREPTNQQEKKTTNSTHIWRQDRESNPGHIGGRWVLSPLRQPCSPFLTHLRPVTNDCYSETRKTMNTWQIFMECLLCSKRRPIRYNMAKPHTVKSTTFAVSGFFLRFHHTSDW